MVGMGQKKKVRSGLDKIEHRLLSVTDQKLDLEIKTTHLGLGKWFLVVITTLLWLQLWLKQLWKILVHFNPAYLPKKKVDIVTLWVTLTLHLPPSL